MIFDEGTNLLSENPLGFLTRRTVYVNEIPSFFNFQEQGNNDQKLKIVRYYSFGWYGCQYNFGRVSYSLLF